MRTGPGDINLDAINIEVAFNRVYSSKGGRGTLLPTHSVEESVESDPFVRHLQKRNWDHNRKLQDMGRQRRTNEKVLKGGDTVFVVQETSNHYAYALAPRAA